MNAISSDAIRLKGDYITPDDPPWDEARTGWNLAVDYRPAAVAIPANAADVARIIRHARANGLSVAAQGTGHNGHPLAGRLEDTVLIRTERMREVEIDRVARRARVGAGALWMDVMVPAGEHGLAPLAGSSPDVGVVGYCLGGGISWLGRRHGLAANSVKAIEVANDHGQIVHATADENPDLFWALRGGGGSFGVVTAIEIELYPVDELYAGWLIFPVDRADEVLPAWRAWVEDLPDEVTSIGRFLNVPPLPEIPEPLRGRRLVVVEAAMLMSEPEAAKLLAPLRELGPEMDTFGVIPPAQLSHLHMDPEHPVPGIGDHLLLEDLTPEAIGDAIRVAGAAAQPPLLTVEFRHLGGALGRSPIDGGALGSIDAKFAMFEVGMAMDAPMAAAVKAYLPVVKDALRPWDAGREYLNFAEQTTDVSRLWPADVYDRLRRVKAEHDPDDVFRANHPVPPANA
jgi:FAD binding domain/Berberine and berberine like